MFQASGLLRCALVGGLTLVHAALWPWPVWLSRSFVGSEETQIALETLFRRMPRRDHLTFTIYSRLLRAVPLNFAVVVNALADKEPADEAVEDFSFPHSRAFWQFAIKRVEPDKT